MIPDALRTALAEEGEEASFAATVLGLVLKRHDWQRRGISSDGLLEEVLGDRDVAGLLLDVVGDEEAAGLLAAHLDAASEPEPMVAWALTKTPEVRARETLIALVDRYAGDPRKEHLVFQAVVGLSRWRSEEARRALSAVAEVGVGKAQALATQTLVRWDS